MIRPALHAKHILGLCFACVAGGLHAEVTMPVTFADNMLLQRGKPIPVHGKAAPAESVTVEFAGQRKEARADATGKWRVVLDSLSASSSSRR